ncbi:MAG: isoprenylcysteine carboxylmethyltransferase family protein [Anaerolineales bacterium]
MDKKQIITGTVLRLLMAIPMLGLIFFWPAGTFDYWQAWAYLAVLFIPMAWMMFYFIRNDPDLLERRMRTREEQREQSLLMKLMMVFFVAVFLFPGFDRRFGWSDTPDWLSVLGLALVFVGYISFFFVLRENSYASRVIEVEESQKVIDSGPYALVRHPMYAGVLLMYGISPLALGSLWGMLPMALLPCFLVARILNEEKVLREELEGYEEYTQKVKWRLIPRVW